MEKKISFGLIAVVIAAAAVIGILIIATKKFPESGFPGSFFEQVKEETMVEGTKKLFIVHSYGSENVCGKPQDQGAMAMLEKLGYKEGKNIKVYRFYMDTKKVYTSQEEMKTRGEMALAEIREAGPDIILTLDDNAFRYVAFPLAKGEYPLVFSGMNKMIESYDEEVDVIQSREHPGYNITGVLETKHWGESIRVLQQIVPDADKVLCIADTTPTGKANIESLNMEIEKMGENFPAQVEIRQVSTFEEYKKVIREANERQDIDAVLPIVFGLDSTEKGKRLVQPELTGWTAKNCNKPDIGTTFFIVNFGTLSGAAVDFPALGGQAAVKVAQILEGENPGNISIDEAADVCVCVNLARAEQLGLKTPLELIAAADKIYTSMDAYPEYKIKRR